MRGTTYYYLANEGNYYLAHEATNVANETTYYYLANLLLGNGRALNEQQAYFFH